jgi:hypothetical protein
MRRPHPSGAATLTAPVRSVLLATLTLLVAAPAAQAAVTVSIKLTPAEAQFGKSTEISGTVLSDGAPLANQPVELDVRRYPFEVPFAPLATTTTAADGTYSFTQALSRNAQFRVIAAATKSHRVHAYVFPATTLTFVARSSRMIRLTQRYKVPKGVRLTQPTIFYVGKRGRATAPRVATGKLKKIRAGRYRSSAIVRLPAEWHGRFRYASCFRYTGGSGMGNPRATCPKRFRF